MKTFTLITIFLLIGIALQAQTQEWLWAQSINGYAGVFAVCTDVNDNVYATGYFFDSTIVIGNDTLLGTTDKGHDPPYDGAFLVKYNSTGLVLWAKTIPRMSVGYSILVATDNIGNVYMAGISEGGTLIIGTDTIESVENGLLLIKYDASGNIIWVKNPAGTGFSGSHYAFYISPGSICTDGNNNLYVVGNFYGNTVVFGGDTLNSMEQCNQNIFLAKYDSSGNVIWVKGFNCDENWSGIYVSTDTEENIYITGGFTNQTFTLGNIVLTTNGSHNNIFITKFDPSGNVVWAKTSEANDIFVTGISTESDGTTYITGDYNNIAIFENDTLSALPASPAIFIAKYNPTGNVIWSNSLVNASSDGITDDGNGNIYINGFFYAPENIFGPNTLYNFNSGSPEIFLAKLDSLGNIISAEGTCGIGEVENNSICSDKEGNIYITGSIDGSDIAFGSNTVTNPQTNGDYNCFISKYGIGSPIAAADNNPIKVYPNPSSGQFLFNGLKEGSVLEIFNMLGQKIYSGNVTCDCGYYLVDIGGNTRGIYIYRAAQTGKNVYGGRLLLEY